MKKFKVIISGGGTGGHIFPAIAIAKALQKAEPKCEILFVGAEGKMEMEKVPQAGYEIIGLPIAGIQRKFTWKNFLIPFKIWKSLRLARKIIRNFKPDVAIGVGGYASGPLLRVASSMNIPTVIQEQNSYPGITNKLLAKRARKICVAYEGLESYFPREKIIMTGNPVRLEVTQLEGKREKAFLHFGLSPAKKTIFIVGGSLGARSINEAVDLQHQQMLNEGWQVIWQTGKNYTIQNQPLPSDVKVHTFISDMDLAYAAADIVVSRAGAMSISELCLVGKPTILVPSPNVAEDHQTKNAMALVNREAALLVTDANIKKDLFLTLKGIVDSEERQAKLSQHIFALGKKDAAESIAREVLTFARL